MLYSMSQYPIQHFLLLLFNKTEEEKRVSVDFTTWQSQLQVQYAEKKRAYEGQHSISMSRAIRTFF